MKIGRIESIQGQVHFEQEHTYMHIEASCANIYNCKKHRDIDRSSERTIQLSGQFFGSKLLGVEPKEIEGKASFITQIKSLQLISSAITAVSIAFTTRHWKMHPSCQKMKSCVDLAQFLKGVIVHVHSFGDHLETLWLWLWEVVSFQTAAENTCVPISNHISKINVVVAQNRPLTSVCLIRSWRTLPS